MVKTIYAPKQANNTLDQILEEIRRLRLEVSLFLPQENLKEYNHPERIKQSYEKALRKFPPHS